MFALKVSSLQLMQMEQTVSVLLAIKLASIAQELQTIVFLVKTPFITDNHVKAQQLV